MADEQPYRFSAALDTSGGIDTRTYLIYEIADGDGLSLYPRDLHDRTDTFRRHGIQGTQAIESQDAVLARNGHYIRGDGHRQERQESVHLLHIHTAAHGIRLCEFETHAAAAQFLERIEAIGALHIQHRDGIRNRVSRRMMVTDDKIYSYRTGICHLLHRLNTTVQRNDESTALFLSGINTFGRDTITLGITIGDIIDEVIRKVTQEGIHERHCRGTIYIVIAVNHDPLMVIYCSAESVHSRAHVPHQERVMEAIQRRTDISAGLRSRADTSSRQETAGNRTDVQFGTQALSRVGLLRGELFYVPVNLHSAIGIQQSAFSSQHSAVSIQYSAFSIQNSDDSHLPPAIAAVLRGNGVVSR